MNPLLSLMAAGFGLYRQGKHRKGSRGKAQKQAKARKVKRQMAKASRKVNRK